jgi:hypothetical protein
MAQLGATSSSAAAYEYVSEPRPVTQRARYRPNNNNNNDVSSLHSTTLPIPRTTSNPLMESVGVTTSSLLLID